jgi:outer membrane immunogenic protein
MRFILLVALALGGATATLAQDEMFRGDAAVTYHWVHTNAAPGDCGCFGINGAGISGSWDVHGPWSAVAEFSSEFRPSSPAGQNSLTLTSFVAGARYHLPQPFRLRHRHMPQYFAEALVGPAHAGGGEAGVADGTWAFALRVGGGIDVPLKSRFQLRAIQVDWYRTQFANTTNDRQNNLLIAAGIVYRWSFAK